MSMLSLFISLLFLGGIFLSESGSLDGVDISTCGDSNPIHYNITEGYIPLDFPNVSTVVDLLHHNVLQQYLCPSTTTHELLSVHFQTEENLVGTFSAKRFLRSARNKNIVIVGDTFAKQLHLELFNALIPYLTDVHTGLNWTTPFTTFDIPWITSRYTRYNVTLDVVKDPLLENFDQLVVKGNTEVIIFSVGQAFRPFFRASSHHHGLSYYQHMEEMIHTLNETLYTTRMKVKGKNNNTRIVWRLIGHVGMFDEEWDLNPQYFSQYNTTPHASLHHHFDDGLFWSNTTYEATWVEKYNGVIREVANANCDMLLDAHSMSLQYINHFTPRGIAVHFDGMHYCPGGTMKGEIWLTQQLLYRHHVKNKQKKRESTPNTNNDSTMLWA
eukprot:scaffold591_cov174-Ochromonas_danica.AAC.4